MADINGKKEKKEKIISGEKIKEIRLKQVPKMSRVELSRLTKIPLRTLEDWEAGKRNPSDYNNIMAIKKVLKCSISDLKAYKKEKNENIENKE